MHSGISPGPFQAWLRPGASGQISFSSGSVTNQAVPLDAGVVLLTNLSGVVCFVRLNQSGSESNATTNDIPVLGNQFLLLSKGNCEQISVTSQAGSGALHFACGNGSNVR